MAKTQTDKKELRRAILNARTSMQEKEYAFRSQKINAQLQSVPEIKNAHVIHAFWPIIQNREVDVRPVIQTCQKKGKLIVLPYVVSFSSHHSESDRLEHRLFTGETNLRANRWDVYEPQTVQTVPITDLDAVIVPALAVDQDGFRLGYGKGFYDEFLSQIQCPTICPVFDSFFLDRLPREEHDIPVRIVVYENGYRRLY